jgi:mono/diheme cytochrome c family protein
MVIACLLASLCWVGCAGGEASDEQRRVGERLFREQGCIVCHGPAGRGDGERAAALNPRPRDFRDRSAYVQGTTARDIAETLATGIRVHSASMPSFDHLTEPQRLAVGEFIVSLQRVRRD